MFLNPKYFASVVALSSCITFLNMLKNSNIIESKPIGEISSERLTALKYSKTLILEYFYCRQEFLLHKSPRFWNTFLADFPQKC